MTKKLGGLTRFTATEALNLMANSNGVKHLDSSDGKYTPENGAIGIIPFNGPTVTVESIETVLGDDVPGGTLYFPISLPIKSVQVSTDGGECLVVLFNPNDV